MIAPSYWLTIAWKLLTQSRVESGIVMALLVFVGTWNWIDSILVASNGGSVPVGVNAGLRPCASPAHRG